MCVRKAKFPMIMRWISKQQTTTSQTSLRLSVLTTMVLAGIFIAGQAANLARAESIDDAGLWWAFFGQGEIGQHHESCTNNRLKWWFDGHSRFLDDADGFNQSIVRPGLGISISERAALWAGYGWIRTSPLSGPDFDEHRIWQQWTWSASHDPFAFALRSRLEQRFIETGDDTGWRFRQLVRAQYTFPCNPCRTAVVWDELFIHLNDTDWGAHDGVNQNRLFVGLGIKRDLQGRRRTEIGYLNQTINVAGKDNRMHHILSINVYRRP